MRSDLNKLLCEHERNGSRDHYKNYRKLKKFNPRTGEEFENLPAREGMKLRYGWDCKSFGENLNPLYGAVRKAVGRPWNKFYSELCENFDKRSVINQHILVHLFQYVEVDTVFEENGELYVRSAYRPTERLRGSSVDYYVDPRDGILKLNKHRKSWKQAAAERQAEGARKLAERFRKIDDNNVLHKIDGVWYHFELKEIPEGKIVYEKPYGFTQANVNPSWMKSQPPIFKTWEEMNESERQRFGSPKLVGASAFDLFNSQTVVRTKHGLRSGSGGYIKPSDYMHNKYHATKKTASHKLLKQAGIV